MQVLNDEVVEQAATHRLKTATLGDGEVVIRTVASRWVDYGHAGAWNRSQWYVLIPARQPKRVLTAARAASGPEFEIREADDALLVIGPKEAVQALLRGGPRCFRARRRGAPGDVARLTPWQFRKRR